MEKKLVSSYTERTLGRVRGFELHPDHIRVQVRTFGGVSGDTRIPFSQVYPVPGHKIMRNQGAVSLLGLVAVLAVIAGMLGAAYIVGNSNASAWIMVPCFAPTAIVLLVGLFLVKPIEYTTFVSSSGTLAIGRAGPDNPHFDDFIEAFTQQVREHGMS